MKKIFLSLAAIIITCTVNAQKYPEPEFSNEVYYLKKDSVNSAERLEKNVSKMESKTKMGGLGGSESGYEMDGTKSTVRLPTGAKLSFIISTGASSTKASSPADSMMKASGMDPSMMSGMPGGMNDPASTITLYKTESEKGKRKILMQKNGGAMPFASKKTKSSDKYTFSVKKIREGYWELVIDKTLPKGEYAFSKMDMTAMSSGMSFLLFAFGID
jgi:uncharacterized protein YxeA